MAGLILEVEREEKVIIEAHEPTICLVSVTKRRNSRVWMRFEADKNKVTIRRATLPPLPNQEAK